ncbi:diguanylate cyclase domain-containing protein [Streptomyces spiralis]
MLATSGRSQVHLLLLDANGFKAVNDTYGNAAGDTVIHTPGWRLAHWTSGRQALAARWAVTKSPSALFCRPRPPSRSCAPSCSSPSNTRGCCSWACRSVSPAPPTCPAKLPTGSCAAPTPPCTRSNKATRRSRTWPAEPTPTPTPRRKGHTGTHLPTS